MCNITQAKFQYLYMNRWLLIQRDYGQLCNRLHTHANALAWCIENRVNLVNLSFKKYSQLFTFNKGYSVETMITDKSKFAYLLRVQQSWNLLEQITRSNKWLNRLTNISIREKDDSEFVSENEHNIFFHSETKTRAMLIRAWDLRFPVSLKKHQEKIREILSPTSKVKNSVNQEITILQRKFDCLIGVHARRTDYKEYLGGIHFHSWDSYRNWMVQTKRLMEGNGKKRVGFLLCSDENPHYSDFNNLPVVFRNDDSVMSDLYSLSQCDFNIGPPSSFGTWVSWYGQIPRITLQKGLQIQSFKQFQICNKC
jgi:hypothetical protein